MIRDLATIQRNLEDKKNNDIIYKKNKLQKMFEEDPDILEILGKKEKQPLNTYKDPNNPTEEEKKEREEILRYNKNIDKKQIIPFLKINDLQKEVINYIMFDITDSENYVYNSMIKKQILQVMCLVHEDDMDTPLGIVRTDLLSYLVKDILCWSNVLGNQIVCISDYPDIVDSKYYCRTLKFEIDAPNVVSKYRGMSNKYDGF